MFYVLREKIGTDQIQGLKMTAEKFERMFPKGLPRNDFSDDSFEGMIKDGFSYYLASAKDFKFICG